MNTRFAYLCFVSLLFACNGKAESRSEINMPLEKNKGTGVLRIAILGDRTGRPDDAIFEAALTEAARLKPDFVLSIGDLIEGYQPDERIKEAAAEWDYVLAAIRDSFEHTPLYVTAGNHDIWSEKSKQLFKRKLGHAPNFSFDAGPVRIILFDSSRQRSEPELSERNLNWLMKELFAARKCSARIVVTHVPLWAVGQGGTYGAPLHDVLIAGNADWVITGHWHHTMSDDRDGIRYRIIGPSGALPNSPGHPESGNFPQIGLLTIDRGKVDFSIIPVGSLLPSDSFTYDMNQLEWQIENTAMRVDGLVIDPFEPRTKGRFTIQITNVTDEYLKSVITLKNQGAWTVTPSERSIALLPGESKQFRYLFTRDRQAPVYPGPTVELPFPWQNDKKYVLRKNISPIFVYRVKKARTSPVVDGILKELAWNGVKALTWSKAGSEKLGDATMRIAASGDSIYIGAELPKNKDTENSRQEYFAILLDDDVKDYKCARILINQKGDLITQELDTLSGTPKDTSTPIVERFKISLQEDTWTVEAALKLTTTAEARQDQTIRFNAGLLSEDRSIPQAFLQPLLEQDLPSFGVLLLPK